MRSAQPLAGTLASRGAMLMVRAAERFGHAQEN